MQDASILIVGAGTWGASTALHLARRGYTNVTVLDAYPQPSAISAGNDVNKIVSFSESSCLHDDPDYANRTFFAALSHGFRHDPVFQPHFHETGAITSAVSPEALKHIHRRDRPGDAVIELNTPDDFRQAFPSGVLTGPLQGWKGYWKQRGAGWVHARHALLAAITEAQRLGVRFIGGDPEGKVVRLLFSPPSSATTPSAPPDVIGVETADGTHHHADRVILAAGANADHFLDFKNQLRPTAWTLAHIRLTAAEAAQYRNLPVLFNADQGFFMEPDADRHELKICDEHPGYCNWVRDPVSGERRSVPFARHQIPVEAEERIRGLLRATMPQLAERPLAFARICWCADTVDRNFLIDVHPEYKSLVLAVGASGRGFAHIPSIGGFVVDRMEGRLEGRLAEVVRWRAEAAVGRDWEDTLGRFGGEYRVMDFGEVQGWTNIGEI
ncbi:NAD(P)/FAD-dependent oxidoreductase [Aspergillus saccharolyticus JOP 1030-1]|uniref:FAD dependent oxidoreductase n=1 Tax=Aspergillus saccharolyticus JOP 1030-1 TaxID=1450539 RepID=A0A318ZQH4_9EURO|nr:FAD dependent oxidoreductase [Aspergillus saccharolyticus JOP 1030-1]PYH42358.1 FAD dependent oxidoreductase [Aspergillus saccharolyticus JOP 1030-1]